MCRCWLTSETIIFARGSNGYAMVINYHATQLRSFTFLTGVPLPSRKEGREATYGGGLGSLNSRANVASGSRTAK